jgi:hypothetical protein
MSDQGSGRDKRGDRQAQLVRMHDSLELFKRRALYRASPVLLVQYLSLKYRGRLFHPRKARSFEDKLLWLMLYWREPLKTLCADKYAVRSYVADQGLAHLLPGLLGVYADADGIDFAALPDRFVLKCTHGSGFNIICRDKARFDVEGARARLDKWMKVDLSKIAGEVHYAAIEPRIICEAYLGDPTVGSLNDYKIYCFDGKPHCTMVCTGRGTGQTRFDFYDLDWRTRLAYCRPSLSANRDIPRPAGYEGMIEAAEKLAGPFPFVRVDFYSFEGRAVLGEMTFTPRACIDNDLTDLAQTAMGELIVLPKKLRRPSRRGPSLTT